MMTKKNTKFLIYVTVALLLTSMFFLMFTSSRGDSATTDESTHIISGYLANIDGDYNINTEHPYLGKKINTLPLLFMDVKLDRSGSYFSVKNDYYYDSWRESRQLGNDFLYKMDNDADRILRAVRSVPMILTLTFGLIFFIVAYRVFGLGVGLLALVFWVFSPDILAHARFVNTDLWITVFYFLSVMSFGFYLAKPNYKRLVLAAVVFGLALSVKFSSVTLIPVLVLLWFIKHWLNNKESIWQNFKTSIVPAILFLVIGWLIIWANYGFSTFTPPKYEQKLEEHYYNKILVKTQIVARYFIPAEYYKGVAILSSNSFGFRPAYLFGESKYGGWWYYFLVAYAVKTPLPTLILLVGSIIFYLLRAKLRSTVGNQKLTFNDYLILTPIIVYLLISMGQKLNIGVRHLLPIMPFIFLGIAKFMVELYSYYKNPKIKIFLITCYILLVTWFIIGTLKIYPSFLSYFNETVGAKNGSQVLTDSNIDWGQDIKRLKIWLDDNQITQPILLEYFWDGEDAISYYGINYKKLEPNDSNQKGYIAIGVSALNNSEFSWLKNYQPINQVGYSINIYNIK